MRAHCSSNVCAPRSTKQLTRTRRIWIHYLFLSLTSTIIQFVDFDFKVTRWLKDYAKAGIDDIPQTLGTIATQIPLFLSALERVKANLADGKLDYDTRCILKGVVSGCMI